MVKRCRDSKPSGGRDRRVKMLPQSAEDPEGPWRWAERYMTAQLVQNYSATTNKSRRSNLRTFVDWCELRGVMRPMEVTKPTLEAFQRHLFYTRRADATPLGFRAQSQQLVTLRSDFRWLSRQKVILSNQAADWEMPRRGMHLPKEALNEREVEVVLAEPDTSDRYGIRDRAILKDRVVPIGERAPPSPAEMSQIPTRRTRQKVMLKLESMSQPLEARVQNGRLVLDAPTDLPEGTVVPLQALEDDGLTDEEREEVLRAVDEGLADVEAGRTKPLSEVLSRLRAQS